MSARAIPRRRNARCTRTFATSARWRARLTGRRGRVDVRGALVQRDVEPLGTCGRELRHDIRGLGGGPAQEAGHATAVVSPVTLVQLLVALRADRVGPHVEADVDR